jgi:hypothetical protein
MNTVDILPDLIGLAFIYAGIGKASYINENLLKAKNYINYFFVFSGLKFVWNAVYLIFGEKMFEAKILEDNLISLLSLAFAIIELILSMAVFINILKGLGIFFIFKTESGGAHEKKSELVSVLLKIFFVLKFVFAAFILVPELLTDINLDNLSVFFGLYLDGLIIKNMLVPPFFIIQSLFGIFVFSVAAPFFFETAKNSELCEFIREKINLVSINDNFYSVKNRLKPAFAFFAAGCVFFADFLLDNINILPDFIVCVFFLSWLSLIVKANPELKNKKLGLYLLINLFISVLAYISDLIYRVTAMASFTDENIHLLRILKLSSDLFFHASVILFFLAFIEFYAFIRALQRKNFEFSERYLNKYFMASEKDFDKNKNKIIIGAAFAFCVKTFTKILPQWGILMFYHSLILFAFSFFVIKGLYSIRDAIYSYYR